MSKPTTPSPFLARLKDLTPALVFVLREGYGWADLRADLLAGLTVAIIALPLSMALGIASGATPAQGLITAMAAGFLTSALGGSRYQIGGPTGAFVVIVAGVIATQGYDGLLLAGLMAGAILIGVSLMGLGGLVRYISDKVVVGFTSGIAIIIASSQMADFLGLTGRSGPEVIDKFVGLWRLRDTLNPASLTLGLACLFALAAFRRWAPRLPSFLLVLAAAGAAVALLHLKVVTIGDRFGDLHAGLALHLPALSLAKAEAVAPAALTIAFLAALESLLASMVADSMTGSRHRPNAELMGQGVANIASALLGGLPATGAVARTATNIRAGGRSPIAGMTHSLVLLAVVPFAGPLIAYTPLPALAAILFIVSWNMAEAHRFVELMKGPTGDKVVLLATFGLTLFVNLPTAIGVGVVFSAVRFMHRMAQSVAMEAVQGPSGVQVFEISGPLFFGAVAALDSFLANHSDGEGSVIIRLERCNLIDATAARLLGEFVHARRNKGGRVVLCGAPPTLAKALAGYGVTGGAQGAETAADFVLACSALSAPS